MTEAPHRPQKKTEMIEVRVSAETKHEFLDACRRAGRTASDVVRESVDDFVVRSKSAPAPEPVTVEAPNVIRLRDRLPRKRWLAAGGALAVVSLFAALPSAAQPDLAAAFRALDANGDGALTPEEYSARGGVERRELMAIRDGARQAAAPDAPPVLFLLPPDEEAAARMADVRYQRMSSAPTAQPDGKAFAATDVNLDGRVDLAEFLTRQKVLLANGFLRLDADASGGLDKAEYEALTRPFLMLPQGADPIFGGAAKYGGLRSALALEPEFKRLDADGDGMLSLDEYLQH